jgi:hypothetical protein
MSLTTAIQLAQEKNESVLAQSIPPAKPELDSEGLMHLRHYAAWCKQRGVRFCPSKPSTIAAFIRSEAANAVPPAKLFAAMLAIEAMHDSQNESNPVACAAPRAELMRIMDATDKKDITIEGQAQLAKVLDVRAPESWNKSERLLFDDLPPAVKGVISRRDEQQRRAVRHAQNEAAQLRHELINRRKFKQNDQEVSS